MVNVIENRALLCLRRIGDLAPGPADGWLECRVRVDESVDVEGYPNLLATDLPRELNALLRAEAAPGPDAAGGWRVEASLVAPGRLRVERTIA